MGLSLKSRVLRLAASVVHGVGGDDPHRLRILTYHGIEERPTGKWQVAREAFEAQMRFLRDAGYRTYTVAEILEKWPEPARRKERAVAITFDDGFLNNLTVACGVLARFGMKATFFIPTENIGVARRAPVSRALSSCSDSAMLCWNDLRKIRSMGHEIGSHSHSHDPVAALPRALAQQNVAHSKRLLESELKCQVVSFAYPYGHGGSFAPWTGEILRLEGFRAACTQMGGALSEGSDLLQLARIGIKGTDSLAVFRQKVSGSYDFLRWIG